MKAAPILVSSVLLGVVFCTFLPNSVFAADLIKEQDGTKCVDLEAAYAEVNDSSQALTNNNAGVDAIKRANMLATITNVASFFVGDQLYCVKDEVAASRVSGFEKYGLIGQIQNANETLMASFPSVDVGSHLAEMFIPGYGNNNSALAQTTTVEACQAEKDAYKVCMGGTGSFDEVSCDSEQKAYTKCTAASSETQEAGGFLGGIQETAKNSITGAMGEDDPNAEEEPVGTGVTQNGYDYLKDTLHLNNIWSFTRDLAYVGFVIVVIIIGFMIMFRKNIGGQILVSIGNSIPNLIIGIVLVPFSFAITGLVLDLGKIGMNITQNVFIEAANQDTEDTFKEEDIMKTDDVGSLYKTSFNASTDGGSKVAAWLGSVPFIGGALSNVVLGEAGMFSSVTKFSRGLLKIIKGANVAETVKDVDFKSGIPGAEIGVTILEIALDIVLGSIQFGLITAFVKMLIVMAICFYASIRLFITIIVTYFKLFLSVVLAPIQIMIGSLPGNSGMITSWFKGLAANVLTFVAIVFVINFFTYLASVVDPSNFNFFGNTGLVWPNWLIPLKGVIVIGGYLFAASLPGIINGLLKVEQSKELATAGMDVKKAVSKIPLIGSAFGG